MTSDNVIIIGPELEKRSFAENVREFWSYRALIWAMIERDLRVRYKGSVLGVVWSMLIPVAQACLYTIVFGFIMGGATKNLSAYIFCSLVPWLFFSTAILDSSQSILGQLPLIKKVYFPRELPVIAAVAASLIHLLISLAVFAVYRFVVLALLFGSAGPPAISIIFLPLVLLELFILTVGISFFVAALNVFFEDVKFIVTVAMQFLMYLTPIIYFAECIHYASRIPAALRSPLYHLYLCNPIAWIVGSFRQMFFPPQRVPMPGVPTMMMTAPFDWRYCLITLVTSTVILLAGYGMFSKLKWRFTERP